MQAFDPSQFQHTTLPCYPSKIAGITLLEETPGFTGIYLRDEEGGLWPARTVSRGNAKHHNDVCAAWLLGPGVHEVKTKPC